jgi:hypothetical protein
MKWQEPKSAFAAQPSMDDMDGMDRMDMKVLASSRASISSTDRRHILKETPC